MQTYRISFGGSTLVIHYSGVRAASLVEFLYQHAPVARDAPPQVAYHLVPGEEAGMLKLYRDGTLLYTGDDIANLAELLLGDSCHHLAAFSRGGLLFHAAALTWQGRGLLLPGATGTGKSTLAAWLLAQGLDYLTDELVFVPHGAETIRAFTRPLNLKTAALPMLTRFLDLESPAAQVLRGPHSVLVSPTLLKSTGTLSLPPLSLIVFPRYQPESDFAWQPLSKAQAGLALMLCLANARNLPDHGFHEVARLAKLAPAYRVTYADLAQVMGHLKSLLLKLAA